LMSAFTIRFTAFEPPPPTPTTLIVAALLLSARGCTTAPLRVPELAFRPRALDNLRRRAFSQSRAHPTIARRVSRDHARRQRAHHTHVPRPAPTPRARHAVDRSPRRPRQSRARGFKNHRRASPRRASPRRASSRRASLVAARTHHPTSPRARSRAFASSSSSSSSRCDAARCDVPTSVDDDAR
jgi:hypothetical protein